MVLAAANTIAATDQPSDRPAFGHAVQFLVSRG